MMETEFNPIEVVNQKVNEYLLFPNLDRNLIKKHSHNLNKTGDLNFPTKLSTWYKNDDVIIGEGQDQEDTIFSILKSKKPETKVEDHIKSLKSTSKEWSFPRFSEVIVKNDRCFLYLERCHTIKFLFNKVLNESNFAKFPLNCCYEIEHIDFEETNSISKYRCIMVKKCLENLLKFCDTNSREDVKKILVVGIDSKVEENNDSITINCAYATDPETNKLAKLSYADYYSLRSKDMQLIAMHKYGIRIQDDNFLKHLIHQLGDAAVKIDLLGIKHTNPVNLIRNGHGSSKGAAFILYNSARIETLLRTYDERCQTGQLPELPDFEVIDFSLLKEAEEWELIFNHVFAFPALIKRCLAEIEIGKCTLHLIPQFLNSLVSLFSVYYRRVRILTGNRKHLMPVLLARVYLLKVIKFILNISLSFVDVLPVERM